MTYNPLIKMENNAVSHHVREVIKQTPKERIISSFVSILGEKLGKQAAYEFSTLPEYNQRYEQMLEMERKHIERMKTLFIASKCQNQKIGLGVRIQGWLSQIIKRNKIT